MDALAYLTDDVLGFCLHYILDVGSARDFSSVCRRMRYIIRSPLTWNGLHVDISNLCIPKTLFRLLRRCWKQTLGIQVNAHQERDAAALQLPLYTSWQFKKMWTRGRTQCHIMSQTEMPSQCAGILKFQHLKNFMFGVTTASNFASLRDILQPHPSGYLNTLRGITVNLNMNHAQRIMRLNLNNAETWDVSNVTESEEDTLGTNLRFNVIVGASGITWHLNGIHLETLQINPGNVHFCMSLNFEDSEGNFSIDPLLSYAGPGGILNRKAGCALCREPWYDQLDLCSCGDIYCSEHGGTCINCEFQGCAICIASHACYSQ